MAVGRVGDGQVGLDSWIIFRSLATLSRTKEELGRGKGAGVKRRNCDLFGKAVSAVLRKILFG